MIALIYGTDFDGNPTPGMGEFFSAPTAIEIVEAMQQNPFQASLSPLEFMVQVLCNIGAKGATLPDDPEESARMFLRTLADKGYADLKCQE